jgi:fructose 1,6-bisphosphate aldolase/phosphatase
MRLTLSVLKADVGSIGGHTRPSGEMVEAVMEKLNDAREKRLVIDSFISHTGDDIAILISHTRGKGNREIHQMAWKTFLAATAIAARRGLYGAGQDLLVDAPAGNIRGAGPAVAEIEFEHNPEKKNPVRPAESFMVFAADKCGPGAFNLPLYLAFADPMYCAGLMLPKLIRGFRFDIIDMDHKGGDSIISLEAPERSYDISMLLRDNERFGIEAIFSRKYPEEQAAAISAQRLHNIAGAYTGKDDPVAIVRNQGIFPAPEEILMPFTKAHFVGGDARGSHVMPLMPVPLNTAVTGFYCLPIVSAAGFSIDAKGYFSAEHVDFFANPVWDRVREKAQEKGMEIRSQGWSGAAMLPYNELEYSGFRETVTRILKEAKVRKEKP